MRTQRHLNTLLVSIALVATSSLWDSRPAAASLSTACTFTALVHDTTLVAVAMPVEQKAVWEDGRIVTYSRLHVERVVAGALGDRSNAASSDVWVATLGGKVGRVGQIVDGEPRFDVGFASLVFLKPDVTSAGTGVHRVVARAQGQFMIAVDAAKASRLVPSAELDALATPTAPTTPTTPTTSGAPVTAVATRLAGRALAGATLEEATTTITTEWRKSHAH